MNEYQPNWHNKKTRTRLTKILSFAEDYFCWNDSTRRLHSDKVKIHFGQYQHKLSKYFTDNLLYKTDIYVPSAQSLEYQFSWNNLLYFMNKSGLISDKEVKEIGIDSLHKKDERGPISLCLSHPNEHKAKTFFDSWSLNTHHSELLFQNAEYEVDEFTLRRTHKFQSKSTAARAIFWKGWYDYDVEACSYTLIHQHLVNKVLPWWGKSNYTYDTIKQVYTNKKHVRQMLMNELQIDEDLVKVLLSSILFSANLVNHSKTGFHKKLTKSGYSAKEVIAKALSLEFIQNLIEELRHAWHKMFIYWNNTNNKSCRKMFRDELIDKSTGEITFKRFNPARMRSRIYFELERQVSNIFDEYMDTKICHLMHDGFFTPHQIDKSGLVKLILNKTGFQVNISEKEIR